MTIMMICGSIKTITQLCSFSNILRGHMLNSDFSVMAKHHQQRAHSLNNQECDCCRKWTWSGASRLFWRGLRPTWSLRSSECPTTGFLKPRIKCRIDSFNLSTLENRITSSTCVRMNREAKQTLELDWSDKHQAYGFDDHGGRYSNMSPDTQHHPSSAAMQDQWVLFKNNN